ncbi:hypothetical protein F2P81_009378 [Scophthalmus maximus]|uniref:Uncharacterized protein n=1 Tax=Scophthalmus maximus TaxID=52904 RepID=A0A6A4T6V0_SCOMX|nr:hypothetical protein F2P81_009378 [Scophthalmus maximus]
MDHYPAGSRHKKLVNCGREGMNTFSNYTVRFETSPTPRNGEDRQKEEEEEEEEEEDGQKHISAAVLPRYELSGQPAFAPAQFNGDVSVQDTSARIDDHFHHPDTLVSFAYNVSSMAAT